MSNSTSVLSWVSIIAGIVFAIFLVILGVYTYYILYRDLKIYENAIAEASANASAPTTPTPGSDGTPGLDAYGVYLYDFIIAEFDMLGSPPPDPDDFATFCASYTGTNLVADYITYLQGIATTAGLTFFTEAQFLAAFSTPDGADGINAPIALDGDRGDDGSDGDVGPEGLEGAIGPDGIKGLTGEIGDTFVSFLPNNEIITTIPTTTESPEFYPSCEFVGYPTLADIPGPMTNTALIRYYFKGNLMFVSDISWTNESMGNGPTLYLSILVYTSDPFQIVGITSPVTISNIGFTAGMPVMYDNISVSITKSYTNPNPSDTMSPDDNLLFRLILSKNKGLTESVFTYNVADENLANKPFLLVRQEPTDPFIKRLYDLVQAVPNLSENFDIEQKCKISEIATVSGAAATTLPVININ